MQNKNFKPTNIEHDNTIFNPTIIKYKEIINILRDSEYTGYIHKTLQYTNLKWLYACLSSVLVIEFISSHKELSNVISQNNVFKYGIILSVIIQIFFAYLFIKLGADKTYKKSKDNVIYSLIFHFIVFQCFFYFIGAINNFSFLYFITAVVTISFFPSLPMKFISVYLILNYIIYLVIAMYYYSHTSFYDTAFKGIFVSFVCFCVSVVFYSSRINILVNSKKITLFADEMTGANEQLNFLNNELEKLSMTDGLTGIPNRRAYDVEVEKIWAHCMRSSTPVTVFVIDIDFFKQYNDFFGHPEGDKCLIAIAKCLNESFKRKGDLLARIGGEEFIAVLPSADINNAMLLANTTINAIRELKIEHPKSSVAPYVTISIGVASKIPYPDFKPKQLFDFADKALYQAKKTGRNKCCGNLSIEEPMIPITQKTNLGPVEDATKLLAIVQSTSMCSFSIDYNTGKIEFSNEILNILNIRKPYLNNIREFYKFIIPQDIALVDIKINNMFLPNTNNTNIEFRMFQKSKLPIWIRLSCRLLKNNKNIPTTIVGSMIDITSEKNSKIIIESALDGTFIYDIIEKIGDIQCNYIENLKYVDENKSDLEKWINNIHPDDKDNFDNFLFDVYNNDSHYVATEYRILTKSETIWFSTKAKVYYDIDNKPYMLAGSIISLNNLNNYNQFIKGETQTHKISGLPNRFKFYEDFKNVLKNNNSTGYLFLIDIDNFSNINNIFNYTIGNEFLKEFGNLLKNNKMNFGKLYHYDSDSFIYIFPHINEEQATLQMQHFKNISTKPIKCNNINYQYTFSATAISYPKFGSTSDELIRNADIAMHQIKASGKNDYVMYTKELDEYNVLNLELEVQLRKSVDNNMEGFLIYYHPLLKASDKTCIGAEALLRWRSPAGKLVSPVVVIPCLESIGLMTKVGDWVFRTAAKQCKEWIDKSFLGNSKMVESTHSFTLQENKFIGDNFNVDKGFYFSKDFSMNINISAYQLSEDLFEEDILKYLEYINLDCKHIVLEITEGTLIRDLEKGIMRLNRLRKEGIRIAIDDFGTGYSSLSYFRNLPVDEIKIDRSFVTDIENDDFCKEFVKSIIKITQSIDRIICVEGVENEKQAAILNTFNANILQGFLYSVPLPDKEFEELFL